MNTAENEMHYDPAELLEECIQRNQARKFPRPPICDLDLADSGPAALIQVKYWGRRDQLKLLRLKFFTTAMDYFAEQKVVGVTRAGFITDMCALVLAEHINPDTLACICVDQQRGRSLLGKHCRRCGGSGAYPMQDYDRAEFLKISLEIYNGAWKPFYLHLQLILKQWERSALK